MTAALTVIILTRDEALHIGRCIAAVRGLAARIVVVDSGSTDATCALASAAGAEILHHPWRNYADQFNWALDNAGITTPWTMRLDADEVVTPDLAAKLTTTLTDLGERGEVCGLTVDRSMHFLGRKIRWGGLYPSQMLRLWRTGTGRLEDRWMDEHVLVNGAIRHVAGELADINLNSVTVWTAKHNHYATREAIDHLTAGRNRSPADQLSPQARRTRWMKDNIYARLPLGLRPLLYFFYRYILRLGFLDGWQGLAFHGLQGLWYRFLVDVKIAEIRELMKARNQDLATVVEAEYGHRL
jgi:glycosyltransferase involved in cell wall biosynthesis